MKSYCFVLLFSFLLSGCASWGHPPEPYQLSEEKLEITDYGIAIGRVTTKGITGIVGKYDDGATFFSIRKRRSHIHSQITFILSFPLAHMNFI